VTGTTVPKTAVDEEGDLMPWEYEIWISEYLDAPTPSCDAVLA
jgi:hypothetical protein